MGTEHMMLNVKQIFPATCIFSALCSLPFFNKTIAAIIDTTISKKGLADFPFTLIVAEKIFDSFTIR